MHNSTKRQKLFLSLKSLTFLVLMLFTFTISYGQVPSNDDPCNAIVLIPAAACNYQTFSNVDASNSNTTGIPDPSCGAFVDADVWFKAVVPVGATSITISTLSGPGATPPQTALTDGAMSAYTATGSCPSSLVLTEIGCNDNNGANPMPQLTVSGAAGSTIYIRMWGFIGETGRFGICVTANIPPANDECANAQSLTVNPDLFCGITTAGTTVNATTSSTTPIPTCGLAGANNDDVWYSFVATATSHRISLSNVTGSSTAMLIGVYSGACGALTQIGCVAGNTIDVAGLTINQTYRVRVYTNVLVGTANFSICIGTTPPPPVNNECTGAVSLTVNPDYNCGIVKAGTTVSATPSTNLPAPTCNPTGIDDDVWFSFVALNPSHRVSLLNITGGAAMSMNIYSGTCTNLIQQNCNTTGTVDLFNLTVNTTYYVRVYTTTATVGSNANFNICVGTPPPPPLNDECSGAVSLTVNSNLLCGVVTAGTTVSASTNLFTPAPSCGVAGAEDDDVWFKFQATGTTHRISLLNVTGGTTAMVMTVYSGTCSALTEIACNTTSLMQVSGLIPNNIYYVRVFTNTSTFNVNSNFNICVGTPPPPPANNECTGAITATVNPDYLCGIVTSGNTASATPSTTAPTPSCSAAGIDDDIWFKFTATNVTHRISLLNISGGNAMASVVYSGTCAALTQINCSTINLYNVTGLTIGQTYYVRVYTTANSPIVESTFNLCIGTPPPPPANDNCTGAIPLTVNANQLCGVTTAGSTEGATQSSSLPTPTCSVLNGWNDDVWYSFVATGNNHTVSLLNVTGTSVNMVTSVYQGTCGALTQIQCTNTNPNVITMANLTAGTTYYVRVHTAEAGAVNANFSICVGTPGPGANCGSGNPFCSTSGVTYPSVTNQPSLGGGTGTIYGCLGSTPNPTWFAFQVATAGNLVFNVSQTATGGGGIDVDYAAWGPFTSQADGCTQLSTVAPPIQPISCSYSTAAVETITIPNVLVGQWYIVLITNFNGSAGTITFNTTTGNTGATNCAIVCSTTASNNGPVCAGGTFNLTSTALTGSTYSWTGPNGFTSTLANPTGVVAPATAGSYVYTLTTQIGSTACSANTTVVVTAPPPAPTVVSPITYCQNATSVPLTATATGTGNTLLYYTTPTGGVGVPSITPSTATIGSTIYYVSQGSGTCIGPRAQIQVNVVLTTTAAPVVTSPVTYCIGATATQLSATALPTATLNWYGTNATGGVATTTAPTPSTAAIGTIVYYVSQTIGQCESPRSAITVNITASTTPPPTITTPVVYCQGATATQLTATGTSLVWYASATGGVGSTTAPTPTTATVGSTIYYVTQNPGNCESPRAGITVTVNATPLTPTVTTPVNYCLNATAVPLSATAATGATLNWYGTSATGGTASATAPTPLTTTVGSTSYYVSQTLGTCEGPRGLIIVNVGALPAAPTVASPVSYCQGATAVPLTATAATGATLNWYGTNASGGTASSTAPTPSTTTIGSTIYYVSQSSNGCESPRSAITVNITSAPAAPVVTTPVVYCQGATATALTATALTGATLNWYGTNATGGTASSTAPTPSTATVGNTVYYVSQTLGTCEGPRAAITVTVNATPLAPTITTPVNYCLNATASPLNATPATGATLNWYGTNATGGTASSTAPTPSTTTVGSTSYYVSQTLGTCEGPRGVIIVNVGALPAAPATSNISYCQGATAGPLTATAATGATLIWYGTSATGGTASSTAPTPSTATVGTTTYYVSQSSNGCESPRASIIVTVNATPAAPVVTTPVTYCQGATATALTATTATGATLIWYGTSATGGTASGTAPTPSTATIGSTTYYVSQTLGTCEGPRAAITVTVNATPLAPTVTTPVNYCLNTTAIPLSATASNGATLNWYGTNATGGTASSTAPTPSTSAAGTINYYVSQTLGTCEGPRALIAVTVAAATPAPTVTAVSYCQAATAAPLTATAATGATLIWYGTNATGGTASSTAPTPSTATVGSTTYYVSQTIGTCEGPRAALVVTISARPAAPIVVSPIAYCQNGNAVPLTAQGTGLIYYTSATGGTGAASLTPSTGSAGSTIYYVSQTTGSCEGPRAAITVNVSPALTANAGNAVTIGRGDQTQLNGTGTAGARYLWTSNIAPLALLGLPTSATTLTPIANPLETTTYTLTVSEANSPAVCPSVSSSVVVTVVSTCINVKNAFTPNGDGINDKWVVYEQSFCFKPGGATVNVFNRYGSKVFESTNYTNTWDGTYKGKPVPDGTYYAVVEFTLLNGNKQVVKTDVTVLR